MAVHVNRPRRAARLVVLVGLVWLLLSLSPQAASAHAHLGRSEPSPDSVLDESPERIVIWFTEPVEPAFSAIEVVNSQSRRVDEGEAESHEDNPSALSVAVQALHHGTYTVSWRNVSSVDGHSTRGGYVFSVGEALSASAPVLETNEHILHSPAEPGIRWLVLLGALAAVGGIGFELMVSRPTFSGSRGGIVLERTGKRLTSRVMKVTWLAMAVLLASSLVQLIVQTSTVFDVSVVEAVRGPARSFLTQTDWGSLWMIRVALVLGMAAVLAVSAIARSWSTYLRILAFSMGLGMLLTLSLASHAAATPGIRAPALFNDYLHLVAAAIWVGGLFHLALGIPLLMRELSESQRREALATLVPRFSLVASLSVAILVITGLYGAWAQVTVIPALLVPYGLTLMVKVGLIALLLPLGALNLMWVSPRLRRSSGYAYWLRRLVAAEALIAILVVLSVGFLTSIEPARQVASRLGIGQERLLFQETIEGSNISLEIEPGRVGPNTFTVSLKDRFGRPITNASEVGIRLTYRDADLGEGYVSAVHRGEGDYVLEDSLISIAGPWQAAMVVRRPDAFDARTTFRFAAVRTQTSSAAITPSPDLGMLMWGLELALIGLVFLGVSLPVGGMRSRHGATVMGLGIASAVIGAVLVVSPPDAATDIVEAGLENSSLHGHEEPGGHDEPDGHDEPAP